MTRAAENRIDIAGTVVSLAAEATELQTRVNELHQELIDLNERIRTISNVLQRLSPS
ncbi:hypothetical protein [Streptomyces sp. HC307]|uniref:hypothetical protein n=1 Tax=Streptomyces flavusporus TaxID=3385496 RepID=UPI003917457D